MRAPSSTLLSPGRFVIVGASLVGVAGLGSCGGKVLDDGSGSGATSSSSSSSGRTSSSASSGSTTSGDATPRFFSSLAIDGQLCLPGRLPVTSAGVCACSVVVVVPERAADTHCYFYAGLSPASGDVHAATVEHVPAAEGHAICTLLQVPPEEWEWGTCLASSSSDGWCYVQNAADGTCPQSLQYSRALRLAPGAMTFLACP